VVILVGIGIASVVLIGLAITDLYSRQAATTRQLCAVTAYQWRAIEAIYSKTGHVLSPPPPRCR
jgi:hypothetical protein